MPPLSQPQLEAVQRFQEDVIAHANNLVATGARLEGAYLRALQRLRQEYEKLHADSYQANEEAAQKEHDLFLAAVDIEVEKQKETLIKFHAQQLEALRATHAIELESVRKLANPHDVPLGRGDLFQVYPHTESHPTFGGLVMVVDKITETGVLGYVQMFGECGNVGPYRYISVPLDQGARVGHAMWKIQAIQ